MQKYGLGDLLITGGAGFIGSNLINFLQANSLANSIKVIDNESVGCRSVLSALDVEFIEADIRNESSLEQALDGVNTVVHLAADTRVIDSIENPLFNFENNVSASVGLLLSMRKKGVNKLINASTGGAIIGEVTPPVNERMVPEPMSPYGAAKLAVEGYCSAFAGSYGIETVSLRFSNIYGPLSYHKGSVVAAFMKKIRANETIIVYGDGEQTRDYLFTSDLCKGIAKAMASAPSGVYQLGTGKPTSINQLIDYIRQVAEQNINVEYKPSRTGEIMHTYCDISRAKQAFDFAPSTSLLDGVNQTWQWFCQQKI
jgi:UDP-glucose 4-epimerase